MASPFNNKAKPTDEINFSRILDLFLKKWFYLVISLAMALIAAKLYLRYSSPVYVAATTLKVEDNENPFSLGFLDGMGNWTDNIQSEIQILKSKQMIETALDSLGVDAQYFNVGTLRTSELYKDDSPFHMVYDTSQSYIPYNVRFKVNPIDETRYILGKGEQDIGEYLFGEMVTYVNSADTRFQFKLVRNKSGLELKTNNEYNVKAVQSKHLVGRCLNNLDVKQEGYMVSILRITMKENVPKFAADFVNTLSRVYVKSNRDLKTLAATQALDFIQGQLDSIQLEVEKAELVLEKFKQDEELVNLEIKVGGGSEELRTLEERKKQFQEAQIEILRLKDRLYSEQGEITVPMSLEGQNDPILLKLIDSYNILYQERITANQTLTATHPKIQEMDEQLVALKQRIKDNIEALEKNNTQKLKFIENEISYSKSNLKNIPRIQRTYETLMREYRVKERIFSTLLESRAEASIAKASIVSSVRVIDKASVPRYPISPNKNKVYIVGAGLGFTIGIILIVLSAMLKNTVVYREEIENISLTPIIGVVSRSSNSLKHKYPQMQVRKNPKSSLSESIRAIRTNLQFVSADKKSKIISITSTVSGEGKSFIIINLAGIISLLNKKVVILDLDLRKPKLHLSFGNDNVVGISTYLVGKNDINDIIIKTEYDNLDIITSGPIPPNPAELIQNFRMEMLIMELSKHYDYILIDTPPIGLVTDGATILKSSDISLYVVRSDYSKKNYAYIPDQLVEEHKIKNLYIILNSVNKSSGRYTGYGYKSYASGYYSEEVEDQPWWKIWKRLKK